MYSLVLDPSSLIPYGEKSEEDKEAIRKLGHMLHKIRFGTVHFSSRLIKTYTHVVAPILRKHHPLPPFQASFLNLLPQFRKIATVSRGSLCKVIASEIGVKFHILETTRVEKYDVRNVGLTSDDDRDVLRIALASAHRETFLVATDSHFFENLNWSKLSRRYPKESQKIKIVKPDDSDLIGVIR